MVNNTLEVNNIYHGDCLELMQYIPDKSIDMILTDIPYGEVNRKSGGLRNLNKGIADVFDNSILPVLIREFVRVCKGNFYIFCGTKQISDIVKEFEKYGLTTRVGAWNKTNPSPMNGKRLWVSGLEFCVYARNPKSTHNEHCKKALWDFPVGQSKIHPTQKPAKLFERLILASSEENQCILDPFLGSGTTAIAAINTGRNYIGIEKEEEYYLKSLERIDNALKAFNLPKRG